MVVTGAGGFVGGYLCEYLEAKALRVRGVVRAGVSRSPDTVSIGNIGADTDWSEALSGECDCLIHLAAKTGKGDPLALYRSVNADGTRNLAEQAAAAGVRRFIYLSSIKVNGEGTTDNPYTADDAPRPEDPYSLTKYEGEQALIEVCARSSMEYTIIRPPLIYGAGIKGNLRRLIKMIGLGMPLPLGSVCSQRSMVTLLNLATLIEVCLRHKNAANQTFLVSDGCDISTVDLMAHIARQAGRRLLIFPFSLQVLGFLAYVTGHSHAWKILRGSLCVNIGKTVEMLGWTPPQKPEEGIKLAVDYALQRKDAA